MQAFLTENVDHYMIVSAKRGQLLWSAITSQALVLIMLYCIYHALAVNENNFYTRQVSHSFELHLVKFPTLVALHLLLSPEVGNGMKIMKYANQ